MPNTPKIIENMLALAETAAASPEAITMMAGSTNTVEAIRPAITGRENQIEVADGIANIKAENPTSDAVYTVGFNAAQNVLELRNLTTGESQGIGIGGTAISNGDTQEIDFSGLGIIVTPNAAFDKTTDIQSEGGFASATAGSTGVISNQSFEITAATEGVMASLTGSSGTINGTAAASSIVEAGGFSGTADLSTTGEKVITLTDGTDSFNLEFLVTTRFANGDDFDFRVNGLGTLFAIDRPSDATLTAREAGGRLDGSINADKLAGAGGDDIIRALGGDDRIFGLAGNDSYDGGSGIDTLDLSDATNGIVARLYLGAVRNANGDTAALSSIENVTGGNFDDLLIGNNADNRLIGRSGDDQISGLAGDDQLFGNTGDDVLRGGDGDDILNGSEGQDSLRGEAGNDVLRGGNGDDIALGGLDDDHIEGGAGSDRAYGQDGDDTLLGGDGVDRLRGDAGDDVINGGDGNDHIVGGADADRINGGAGFDRISGGAGADVFVLTDGFGYDRIFDFEDNLDSLDFSGHGVVSSTADITIRTFNLGADTRIDVAAGEFIVLVGINAANVTAADIIF